MDREQKKPFRQLMNEQPPGLYGSAEVSMVEMGALRQLFLSIRQEVAEEGKPLTTDQRENIKELMTMSVIENGWPGLQQVKQKDLAETACAHACVVAEHLYETRGVAAMPDTVWSYTTKNQFDRYTAVVLRRVGKFKAGSKMLEDWQAKTKREAPGAAETVRYPENVDDRFIYGIGKVERYWPAQLMRYLEAIRLGKASKAELEKFKTGNTAPEAYKIPWSNFNEVIRSAESTEDIAVGVAVKTMEILKSRGLTDEQLTAALLTGYSPGGPINEHGKIAEIGRIWNKITCELMDRPELQSVGESLKMETEKRFKELNYK